MLRKAAISCLLLALLAPAGARTRPHYGDTLHVEIAGNPWDYSDGLARRLVFDGLTQIGADGSLQPALAVGWTAENAERRWLFRLRPNLHFHDGSPLTSASVVASLTASCSSNCPWATVRALSNSILFTSDAPNPQLPGLLAGDEFLVSKTSQEPDGGTGPFQVASDANGVLTLSANDSYWQGRPFLDAIEIRAHRTTGDQWLDLQSGRADVVEVPAEDVRQAQQQHLNVAISSTVELLGLQLAASGPLENASLRAAISDAIDRNALANVIFQKQAKPAASLLPQSVSGFAFLFSTERDLAKARELRGSAVPPALVLQSAGEGARQLAAQRIVLNLREAGLNVQIGAAGARSPGLTLRSFQIDSADSASDLVAIMMAVGETPPAIGSDPASVYKAEREFLERKDLIPLVHLPRAYAIGPRVRGFRLGFDGAPDLPSTSLEAAK